MKFSEEEIKAKVAQIAGESVNLFGSPAIGFAEPSTSRREWLEQEGREEWLRISSEAYAKEYAEEALRERAIDELTHQMAKK